MARHPAVAECAVIGVHDEIKGQVPLATVVLKDGEGIAEAQLLVDWWAACARRLAHWRASTGCGW